MRLLSSLCIGETPRSMGVSPSSRYPQSDTERRLKVTQSVRRGFLLCSFITSPSEHCSELRGVTLLNLYLPFFFFTNGTGWSVIVSVVQLHALKRARMYTVAFRMAEEGVTVIPQVMPCPPPLYGLCLLLCFAPSAW